MRLGKGQVSSILRLGGERYVDGRDQGTGAGRLFIIFIEDVVLGGGRVSADGANELVEPEAGVGDKGTRSITI